MPAPVAVGVDNGGTWIRFKALDAKGRTVWSLKKPSPSVDNLPLFLKTHLKRFRGALPYLCVGSKGVWKQSKRRALERELCGVAKQIVVMSDVEAAWLAAFKSEGILVISGTGSIAYGRRTDGRFARAGGLGPQKGDEGSGYWIGKEWLENSGLRTKDNVRQIARLAMSVIQKAQQGNPVAKRIVTEAHIHLADLIDELARKLFFKTNIPLSISGSILENKWFLKGFLQLLRRKKIAFKFVRRKWDVATAIAHTRGVVRSSIMNHDAR